MQASIQDEQVRVTGKNKDDLQGAMQALRANDYRDSTCSSLNFP